MKNTIRGESFEVQLQEDKASVSFKGALRLTGTEDYAPILEMLKEMLKETPAGPVSPIVLDIQSLEFLNSSGITMLARFVMDVRTRAGISLEVRASEAIPWHARSLRNFQRLMPTLTFCLS